tara:strand:- start:514 stop:1095 length:582 start_codon:yes stop_codon:yes gene_type:complete
MSESLLKKEFKQSDVQRVRNLVNKDFTSSTKQQAGYQKTIEHHEEGEIWEAEGKSWTIKNGLKQNITKLDTAKKASRMPLTCPNCGGPLRHHLAKKMYRIHGFCFDPCTVEYEASLREAGLYEKYEEKMLQNNMDGFLKDLESWLEENVSSSDGSFVTEQGDIEDWKHNKKKHNDTITKKVLEYSSIVRKTLG